MSVKLQTKALYNLLRFNYLEDPKLSVQKWQVEDLRAFTTDDLFKNLKKNKIILSIDDFKSLACNFDSPESFANKITENLEKVAEKDKVFLLIFELWRRLLPERQTFSIFCDEFDHMILQYDQNILDNDEQIQDFLAILQEILETNVDTGLSVKEVYDFFVSYLAHNFEAFLFDYIQDQIDSENNLYAQELIEGFYPFLKNVKYFDFLRAKILSDKDVRYMNDIIAKVIEKIDPKEDFLLIKQMLLFLVRTGDPELFLKLLKKILPVIEKEKDFKHVATIVADFYRRLDREEVEKEIIKILDTRIKINPEKDISKDKNFKNFKNIFIEDFS